MRKAVSMSRAMRVLLAGLLLSALPARAVQPLDRIVAVVNDDVVLASELARETTAIKAQLSKRDVTLPPADVLERQVLERLIMQRLQLQYAERVGIRVDDATLNAALQRIAEQNNLTLSEFRTALQRDGVDYGEFRDELRNQIKLQRLQQRQVETQVSVSPQEIEEFLKSQPEGGGKVEYNVGHVLVATPEAATPEQLRAAREKAEAVLTQLRQGADIAAVAASESDARNALDGASLGWRSREQLPTIFASQVPELEVGEATGPIQSPSGFHVIQLLERRDGSREMVTQTQARHILIQPNAVVSDEDAKLRLQTLRQRIQGGDSFADLARANSDDTGSAVQGGDLGWASPGKFVPEFERVMDELAPGEISEPFQSRFGWHIIQVVDRRQHDSTTEMRRARATEAIRERKSEEALQTWLRRLRDEAYIDLRLAQG